VKPTWSIIIPVKPGGVVRALESLRNIEYPRDHIEVIVAEGSRPSSQRNQAVACATGEYLYFLDDDSIVKPDILATAVRHYSDSKLAAAGGPSLTPSSDTSLQQAFGASLSSLIGGGSVRNRYRVAGTARITAENELILCNLSFRREMFVACGGLDERLYPNEENELMDRILKKGWTLMHDPALAVTRSQRSRYRDYIRQLYTYGRGRGEQTVISRRINFASLVPSLFIIYLLLLPLIHNAVYTLPLLCYAGLVVVTALWEAIHRKMPVLIPLLLLTIPTLHVAYGSGMFHGLTAPRFFLKNDDVPPVVTLRRVEV
jgi:GT2 family glycosyltransferase